MKAFLLTTATVVLLMATQAVAQPATSSLKGRYIMKGTSCAGLNFIDSRTVLSYPEIQCDYPDTLKLKWLSSTMFTLRDKTHHNKGCPPRVYIYQIIKNSGKQLVLKSFWTGWSDLKDDLTTYNKQ